MENEDEFRPRFVDFLTDLMYTRCTDKFAKILANHSVPTYEYSFDYRGQYSIVNLQGEQVDMGVAHGDDLQYIFSDIWGDELSMSPSDSKFARNIFIPLLSNFAKTSVPTPQITDTINVAWPPLAPNKNRVFRIGSKLSLDNDYKEDVLKSVTSSLRFPLKRSLILWSFSLAGSGRRTSRRCSPRNPRRRRRRRTSCKAGAPAGACSAPHPSSFTSFKLPNLSTPPQPTA